MRERELKPGSWKANFRVDLTPEGRFSQKKIFRYFRQPPVYVRGGQVTDWEESQVLAALAVSELSAALR
jgi:hypothetical protein